MIKHDGKEYRNLQEQVAKNKSDIEFIINEEGTLNQFGIRVIEQVEAYQDIPSVEDYKEAHEDWSYGDAFAVGEVSPYYLYILTRANTTHPNDYWFGIGQFPLRGPQGIQGLQGPQGLQGLQGNTGPKGNDGFSILNITSGSHGESTETIPLTEFTLSAPYSEVKEGDLAVDADGKLFYVIMVDTLNDVAICDYKTSIKGPQGIQGPVGPAGGVNKVNNKTGDVVLNANDILADNTQSIQENIERIDERVDELDNAVTITGTSVPVATYTFLRAHTQVLVTDGTKYYRRTQDLPNGIVYTRVDADGTVLSKKIGAERVAIAGNGIVAFSTIQAVYSVKKNGTSVVSNGVAEFTASDVSGTNDGTNWTSLTVDGTTYAIPQGGGGGTLYCHSFDCTGDYDGNLAFTIYNAVGAAKSNWTSLRDMMSFQKVPCSGKVIYNGEVYIPVYLFKSANVMKLHITTPEYDGESMDIEPSQAGFNCHDTLTMISLS